VDYIFIGEADSTMPELVASLESGNKCPDLPGVLANHQGAFTGDSRLNLIKNLDQLPLLELDSFYDLSNYYPPIHVRGRKIINVASTRGCPYQCSFCAAAEVNGRNIRKMGVIRFVDQIQLYVEKGYDSITIYDDTFTIDKNRAVEISKEIINRKLNIAWNCFSRVDCVDYDTLSAMYEAGCYLIMFGCESLNDTTLKKLRKGFNANQCLQGIEIAKRAGLIVSSSFMIGLPGENKNDILNTIRQANNSDLDLAMYPIFEPYPGTPIYQDCQQEGHWVRNKYKNDLMVEQDTTWVPNDVTREDLTELSRYAHRSFYLRPRFIRSFWNIFKELPWERKYRFINAGLDYFLLSKLTRHRAFNKGARFH
jgi:anaerobic magnesium-protoporphyrin IX monomethyl ester cyclase